MTVSFQPNFNACPVGAFNNAHKQIAFSGMPVGWELVDYDAPGQFYSIVTPGNPSGQAMQMWYPANHVGMQNPPPLGTQDFHIRIGAPNALLTCEWDHYWVAGGDIGEGPLKITPQIRWDCIDTEPGMDQMIIVSDAKRTAKPYDMIVQGPTGTQYVQPICPSPGNVQFGVWTHWKTQYDPVGATCSFWQNGVLLRTQTGIPSNPAWHAGFFFAYWAGGGTGSGPHVDTYAKIDNVILTVG